MCVRIRTNHRVLSIREHTKRPHPLPLPDRGEGKYGAACAAAARCSAMDGTTKPPSDEGGGRRKATDGGWSRPIRLRGWLETALSNLTGDCEIQLSRDDYHRPLQDICLYLMVDKICSH